MSIFAARAAKVFVYPDAIDMRSGFEKLAHFVKDRLKANVNHGSLYVFLGKNRRRLKVLYFDGSGLVLVVKRMEKHAFMAVDELRGRSEITRRELRFLLHGSVLRVYEPEKEEKKAA